ncbi:MAG: UDP-N-acetylmuramate dehydrogenase [Flavobacteriaceae bacterium]
MLKFEENISLKPYNTFGIEVQTKYFYKITNSHELKEIISRNQNIHFRVLGGGSNVLFTNNFKGLTLLIANKGIEVLEESKENITVEVQAGENWHEFVLWCLNHDYGGIENLALIPGSVGAAPIQNIGAYGVELTSVFKYCKALNKDTLEEEIITKKDCRFDYRSSIFKTTKKGKYIITSVCFKLQKFPHNVNIKYGVLKQTFLNRSPKIQQVAAAVIKIRQSKLPNPKILGNSGSFFKNPLVSKSHYELLKASYPELPSFSSTNEQLKIPAAWLIDHLGFKGTIHGGAGVHKNQALVLINLGTAKGKEVLDLAKKIQSSVKETFNISLETEVNIL